jgi:hypothetical protein
MAVASLIHRNPVNPGAERRLAAERVDGAENTKEDFLGKVERFVAIAEQVHGEMHDHPLVFGDQLAECPLVAARTALDQGGLAAAQL